MEKIIPKDRHTFGGSVRYRGTTTNNPKGNIMAKQYTFNITASEAFYIQLALGGQVIKDIVERAETTDTERSDTLRDRLSVAQDLASTIGNLTDLIMAEYEDGVVQEFVTNLDQEISELLK